MFNVVLNSFNCTTETAGNANNNKSYYVDWSSRMPKGQYNLSFTFQSEGVIITNITTIPTLYSDIVSSASNTLLPTAAVYNNTNILGTLTQIVTHPATNVCYLKADRNSNPPVYLNNRPFNNLFNIQVFSNDAVPIPWVDETTPTPLPLTPYVLILHFELIKEYDLL